MYSYVSNRKHGCCVIKLEVSEISFSQDFGFTKENQQRPLLCRRQCSHMMSVYFRYIP